MPLLGIAKEMKNPDGSTAMLKVVWSCWNGQGQLFIDSSEDINKREPFSDDIMTTVPPELAAKGLKQVSECM